MEVVWNHEVQVITINFLPYFFCFKEIIIMERKHFIEINETVFKNIFYLSKISTFSRMIGTSI